MFMTPHPPLGDDHEIERGNPEEDAYAFLRSLVGDAIAKGHFRGDVTDVDLAAQVMWSAMHGLVSLEIAKCKDEWVEWRPVEERAKAVSDMMIRGLLKDEYGR
jgi:hypothetical protein